MNAVIYLYDGYYETELSIPAMLFRRDNLQTAASDQQTVKCMDGRRVVIDRHVRDLSPEAVDVLIIPGGAPVLRDDILDLIRACEAKGAVIGGICGGVDYLARAGILDNRRFTSYYEPGKTYDFLPKTGTMTGAMYEADRKVVTAKPEAYLEFALELCRQAGKEIAQADVDNMVSWFKAPLCYKP